MIIDILNCKSYDNKYQLSLEEVIPLEYIDLALNTQQVIKVRGVKYKFIEKQKEPK